MSNTEASIKYWFVQSDEAVGKYESDVPVSVQQQESGIPLPVRHDRPERPLPLLITSRIEDVDKAKSPTLTLNGVSIKVIDVIKSLRLFGRNEAADWYSVTVGERVGEIAVVGCVADGHLLSPIEAERLYPEIVGFDEYQVED